MAKILYGLALALILAGPASAYHVEDGGLHWSTAQNGWACSGNPQVRCINVYDRSGYDSTWRKNVLMPALAAYGDKSGSRLNFSIYPSSRFRIWTFDPAPEGTWHWVEGWDWMPGPGILIAFGDGIAAWTQNGDHFLKCTAATDTKGLETIKHELGHCMGLGHRKLDAHYNCDGRSVMCALGYTGLDAHDAEELRSIYGHGD